MLSVCILLLTHAAGVFSLCCKVNVHVCTYTYIAKDTKLCHTKKKKESQGYISASCAYNTHITVIYAEEH